MEPILIGALGTVPKCLQRVLEELKTRGQIDTIQIAALLKLATVLRRVPET